MTPTPDAAPENLGRFPYVLGGMAFIPLVGVAFGIAAIIWGLITKKRGGNRLVALGVAGISFTIILYGTFYYFAFVKRGGVYDELRTRLTQQTINSLVVQVEFYRVQHGDYPESLKVLQDSLPADSGVSIVDSVNDGAGGEPRPFYYERIERDHYYLRGLGPDGQPFTEDDIVPQVPSIPGSEAGLLLERQSDS